MFSTSHDAHNPALHDFSEEAVTFVTHR
jgi:hypothetical protein